jgi:hypothetical protein
MPAAQDEESDRGQEDEQAGPVVEPQPQEVVGVVDAQCLDPCPAGGVGGDVEGEEPAVVE